MVEGNKSGDDLDEELSVGGPKGTNGKSDGEKRGESNVGRLLWRCLSGGGSTKKSSVRNGSLGSLRRAASCSLRVAREGAPRGD
jgi:hypothetical protein